jgi:hypothetical protein
MANYRILRLLRLFRPVHPVRCRRLSHRGHLRPLPAEMKTALRTPKSAVRTSILPARKQTQRAEALSRPTIQHLAATGTGGRSQPAQNSYSSCILRVSSCNPCGFTKYAFAPNSYAFLTSSGSADDENTTVGITLQSAWSFSHSSNSNPFITGIFKSSSRSVGKGNIRRSQYAPSPFRYLSASSPSLTHSKKSDTAALSSARSTNITSSAESSTINIRKGSRVTCRSIPAWPTGGRWVFSPTVSAFTFGAGKASDEALHYTPNWPHRSSLDCSDFPGSSFPFATTNLEEIVSPWAPLSWRPWEGNSASSAVQIPSVSIREIRGFQSHYPFATTNLEEVVSPWAPLLWRPWEGNFASFAVPIQSPFSACSAYSAVQIPSL